MPTKRKAEEKKENEEKDFEKMNVKELRAELESQGKETKGTKQELIQRLKGDSKQVKETQEENEEEEESEEKGADAKKVKVTPTDFTVPALKEGDLKIVSWNVAGWASIMKKGFMEYVKSENPDIICVQETKIDPSKVPADLIKDYHSHFYIGGTPGYSGTGIFSKIKPVQWIDGIGVSEHDREGRVITAEYEKFYLVNTYIPNSGRKLVNLEKRSKWDLAFLAFLKKLDESKPVIWTGDLNVAHLEIDLKNPKPNKNKTAGFTDKEREGMTNVLSAGFVDTFRHLYPDKKEAYSFWSFMGGARGKNVGWRLDYFIISKRIVDKLGDSYMRTHVQGSDHCPIVIHIALK